MVKYGNGIGTGESETILLSSKHCFNRLVVDMSLRSEIRWPP